MTGMTPREAADWIENPEYPGSPGLDRAIRVLIDHARAAATQEDPGDEPRLPRAREPRREPVDLDVTSPEPDTPARWARELSRADGQTPPPELTEETDPS